MFRRSERTAAAMLAASLLILAGCAQDISTTVPEVSTTESSKKEVTTTTTAATTVTEPETTTTTTTTTTEETTEAPETGTVSSDSTTDTTAEEIIETYKTYIMTDEYNEFISKCVFVGDSICSGFKAYDILPAKNVLAQGNVAARSIYDYTFRVNGDEMSILAALLELRPEYVVFSMGMNDVNITSEQTYCDNYGKLLSEVQSFLPDTTLIVCSITPITYGENGTLFTRPENIDSFNAAIREYLDKSEKWIYCDIAHEMKNSLNLLKSRYLGSPDGVHLAPEAYYAIMSQICERMVDGRVYNDDGTYTELTAAAETEAPAPVTTVPETEAETEMTTNGDLLSGTIILEDLD